MKKLLVTILILLSTLMAFSQAESRPRLREHGINPGIISPGPLNLITDVKGVKVGHFTLIDGKRFNTGITAILPHGENLYLNKVPGAVVVENGYGKLAGSTQVNELGEIETPILLTGTLNVPKVADGLISYMLALPEMEQIYSINPLIGETNDGALSDIRARPLGAGHVRQAIDSAGVRFELGSVGAGRGTRAFGFKGGIGSSSRKLPSRDGGYTIGVLVQSNFGGLLTIDGKNISESMNPDLQSRYRESSPDGSLMIVIATDAPLDHRNLTRLAKRSFLGMARTGGYASNGSGDYAIAFSTHPELRITKDSQQEVTSRPLLDNAKMSPLFLAVVEATEEAILDSLFTATTVEGHLTTAEELPVDQVMKSLK